MGDTLRKLQEIELGILKECLRIIDSHSLTYYMLGGTLLGAIRHQGFIPWDDDIDIGLPRPDYEKFIKIAQKELRSPFRLHLFNSNDEYGYYYIRVENTDVKLKRTATTKDVIINAWIDIFPLDGGPKDDKQFMKWNKKGALLLKLFRLSQFDYFYSTTSSQKSKGKLVIGIKKFISISRLYKMLNPQKRWRALDTHLKMYKYNCSPRIYNFCGYWGIKECFDKKKYGKGKKYKFEDLLLNGPSDYDYVLSQMYGDYMKPPNDADKAHHYVEILD